MSNSFLPQEDGALASWLANFKTIAAANAEQCQLEPADIQIINDDATAYLTKLADVEPKKIAYAAAVTTKNDAKADASTMARTYGRKIKGIPGISPGLLTALGLSTNGSGGPVVSPTGLQVIGCSDGVNKLKWSRAANSKSTSFIIEYKIDGASNWSFAAVVSKVTFNHDNQEPGQTVWYRVSATRAGVTSVPTPPVAAYGDNGDGELSLAA